MQTNDSLKQQVQDNINNKTKPIGALGQLENIALQLALIQNNEKPDVSQPFHTVFAADHGICAQAVNAFPQEVTAQMVLNFLNQGAAINVFCNQQDIPIQIVNAGVKQLDDLEHLMLINKPVAAGTADFSQQAAMSEQQCEQAIALGHKLIQLQIKSGANLISLGEMGIGNTTTAAALMAQLTGISVENCTGAGTGSDADGIALKNTVIKHALDKHKSKLTTAKKTLQYLGGFEIAAMVGAMISAYEQNTAVMIDGFIASSAALVAVSINPAIKDNLIFSHCSNEQGHQAMLEFMQVKPILDLGLRLGEGTGAVLAIPIVQSAAAFLNDMASFTQAQVSEAN